MADVTVLCHLVSLILLSTVAQFVQSLPCDWTNGTGRLIPLISGDITTIAVSSEADCRYQCVSKTSFICAAVNYRLSENKCELLTENYETATTDGDQIEWTYSNRPLCAGIWFPWMTKMGQTIESDNGGYDEVQSSSLKDCMGQCVTADYTVNSCNSIVISRDALASNRCQLHNVSVGESNITSESSNTLQYFGKPPWYRDDSTGISDGFPVIERNNIGRSFRLFNNMKLTLDGYLIGWKYFLKAGVVCANSSHVTIFGKRSSNSYKYVTSTLLQPEDINESGIRFQFQQQNLVPVRANDLLGMYTSNCSPTSAKHLVSVESVRSDPTNTHKVNTVTQNSVENTVSTISFTNGGRFRVSLKAHVAGYTKLPASPSTTHRSVNHGQIRLVIPSPGSPESQGAVLYRIICSADQNFGQSFLCHPELIPVGTPEVVLDGLDVTSPLYAKVEVLRNFNGEEHPEDEKRTQSTFCAERQRLADSDVSINITANGDGTVTAILSNHNITGDLCAESVTISYQQMSITLVGSIADLIKLSMPQSDIYEFEMFLTLADGYEMLHWSWSLDLTPPTSAPTTAATTTRFFSGDGNSRKNNYVASTPISTPVNVAAIIVPILALLIIGVAVVLSIMYVRRRKSNSSHAEPGDPQVQVANTAPIYENDITLRDEEADPHYCELNIDQSDYHAYSLPR